MSEALRRLIWGHIWILLLGTFVLAAAHAVFSTLYTPLDGVEGLTLFEASRVRSGWALYVDPVVGATEYGVPPARSYVLYPPLWSLVCAFFAKTPFLARGLAAVAWFSPLVALFLAGPDARRRERVLAFLFVAGNVVLVKFGIVARPDALAVGCVGWGLVRLLRRRRLDFWVGLLVGLGACCKPNVVGALTGLFLGAAFFDRRGALRFFLGAAAVGLPWCGFLEVFSHGMWIEHLRRSTLQSWSFAVWTMQAANRFSFFLLPAIYCLFRAWREREASLVRLLLVAFSTSLTFCLFFLGKTGSASNYWLEPSVVGLALFCSLEAKPPQLPARLEPWWLGLAVVQCVWLAVPAYRRVTDVRTTDLAHRALLREADAYCRSRPDALIVADEPGIEFALNGRITVTPYQFNHLAASTPALVDRWLEDWANPRVTCLVSQNTERVLGVVSPTDDIYPERVRAFIRSEFSPVRDRAGWVILRRKTRDDL